MNWMRMSLSVTAVASLALSGCLGYSGDEALSAVGNNPAARVVCPQNLSTCGDSCVDTSRDVGNCGTCGNACGQGNVCRNGACTPDTTGNGPCVGGLTQCGRAEICDGVDNDNDGLIDEDASGDVGAICIAPSQRCATAPSHVMVEDHGSLNYEDAALVNQRTERLVVPGLNADTLALAHRLEVRTPSAVALSSATAVRLFAGSCENLTIVDPVDAIDSDEFHRGVYRLQPGSYLVVTPGQAIDRVMVRAEWITVPTGSDAVEFARWGTPQAMMPLSGGGSERVSGDVLACGVERTTVRVRVLWNADDAGDPQRTVTADQMFGVRSAAGAASCGTMLTVHRGLVGLEAGWTTGGNDTTTFQ